MLSSLDTSVAVLPLVPTVAPEAEGEIEVVPLPGGGEVAAGAAR